MILLVVVVGWQGLSCALLALSRALLLDGAPGVREEIPRRHESLPDFDAGVFPHRDVYIFDSKGVCFVIASDGKWRVGLYVRNGHI